MDAERPSIFSSWDLWAAAGFAFLGGVWAWASPRLPDPMPVHFNAAWRADGFKPKAEVPWLLFGLPLAIWLVSLVVGAAVARTQSDPERARAGGLHPLRGLFTLGTTIAMAGAATVPILTPSSLKFGIGAWVVCIVLGIVATARSARAFQAPAERAGFYRCGMFYVNPDDPRLWVEKRCGVGWTLNYARPAAYVVTALLFLIPLLAILVLPRN